MTTKGEQVRAVMREEREATTRAIDGLPLSDQARADVVALWLRVQQAVNAYVGEQDRAIDGHVLPALMRLIAEEGERVHRRLTQAGLAPEVRDD